MILPTSLQSLYRTDSPRASNNRRFTWSAVEAGTDVTRARRNRMMYDTTGKRRNSTVNVVRRFAVKYVRRDSLISASVPGDCPVVATTEFCTSRATAEWEFVRGVDRKSRGLGREDGLVTVTSEAVEIDDLER